jgi:hypothetical protein
MQQVCAWAAPSSIWLTVIGSLKAQGFVTRPMGGGPDLVAVSGSSRYSTNTPWTYWQTSTA